MATRPALPSSAARAPTMMTLLPVFLNRARIGNTPPCTNNASHAQSYLAFAFKADLGGDAQQPRRRRLFVGQRIVMDQAFRIDLDAMVLGDGGQALDGGMLVRRRTLSYRLCGLVELGCSKSTGNNYGQPLFAGRECCRAGVELIVAPNSAANLRGIQGRAVGLGGAQQRATCWHLALPRVVARIGDGLVLRILSS